MARKIKFLPDSGSILTIEAPEQLTVGAFLELLIVAGRQFDLNKNLLTEKKSRATFLVPDAVLPDGDISLFSTIKDPKGNNRQEVYTKIKGFISSNPEKAKAHFNQYGNYTRITTEGLEKLLKSYRPGKSKPVAKATEDCCGVSQEEYLELKTAQENFKRGL